MNKYIAVILPMEELPMWFTVYATMSSLHACHWYLCSVWYFHRIYWLDALTYYSLPVDCGEDAKQHEECKIEHHQLQPAVTTVYRTGATSQRLESEWNIYLNFNAWWLFISRSMTSQHCVIQSYRPSWIFFLAVCGGQEKHPPGQY